jgi:hypothetical protein
MKTNITFEIDSDRLEGKTDEYIVSLWYITQANPASIEDEAAGAIAEHVGREIISRFIRLIGVPLWNHQGRHSAQCKLSMVQQKNDDIDIETKVASFSLKEPVVPNATPEKQGGPSRDCPR